MAQGQSLPLNNSDSQDVLRPGTYQSLLPFVDEILSILHAQTVSPEKISSAQASEQVAPKAKELAQVLESMKLSALSLPGAHLSIEEINNLTDVLEKEGEKRRQILRTFELLDLPLVDDFSLPGAETRAMGTHAFPSPNK
ncbi:hypothetical protein I307_03708 [Cryptococcus deuterogattii 99/473]|uniref:Mediator of RNA polymerase II transcription subunit 9 n=1 Tax=Cryptococcus deuterogattii Ram5 TaxID=1296110 RepID=A0A0D0TAZ0_9TREE|nr:hypothetical protein I309_00735 [Cryptococcus deuterogattii LA55]KIR36741.1 hypothetical protein I352_00052 [Cryptococcus deuterogattii MMRL2647]KIR43212.1 hypothetical protein I313_00053 [Cryptococcus deuterogattii Ram5]KIR92528.1 hypothetical protein I304_03933 [Cryptococcus deuterogattii CBS 10090]KIS01694.1 hypothetical protein L804_01573 [Cryptococcus deuterogattii 2001/935-1]KIY56970.1 hypothetical protein I307_03708 [Cryptococcus deuterogattii 99/473]